MSYEDIVVTKDEGVGIIRLNRPKVLNALSKRLYREVDTAISDMEADAGIKAVIFTGTGDRAFSAGADIHEQCETRRTRRHRTRTAANTHGMSPHAQSQPSERSTASPTAAPP